MKLTRDQRQVIDESPGWGLAWLVACAVAVVVVLTVGYMWVEGVGFFSEHTAETRGQTGQREQTQANGQYRIAAANDFHSRCNAIVALDQQIGNSHNNIAADQDSGDQAQLYVDQRALRGQQNQRASLAAEYNSRADSVGTTGPYRDQGLPGRIGQETPTCG